MNISRDNCDKDLIAVGIFAYNRPWHLEQALQSIILSAKSDGYCFHIFIDGPKKDEDLAISASVINICEAFREKNRFCSITLKECNHGLANSIISGLNSVFECHDSAIVIEDDILVSSEFFEISNYLLHELRLDKRIGSIAGYNETKFPFLINNYFLLSPRHSSWGWATWADRWNSINLNVLDLKQDPGESLENKVRKVSPDLVKFAYLLRKGQIDSWATVLNYDFIFRDLLCVTPRQSLIQNIGKDGSGTHFNKVMKPQRKYEKSRRSVSFSGFHNYDLRVSKLYNLKVRYEHSNFRRLPIRVLFIIYNHLKFLIVNLWAK